MHHVNDHEENRLTARYKRHNRKSSSHHKIINVGKRRHIIYYINMITYTAINIKYHDIYPSGKVHVDHKIHPVERNKY